MEAGGKGEGVELFRFQLNDDRAPHGEPVCTPLSFLDLPGWADDAHDAALRCYLDTCGLLPSAPRPPSGKVTAAEARQFFEAHFQPVLIGADEGLVTSYFEPVLPGALEPGADRAVPVYRRPPDLFPLPQAHRLRERGLTAGRRLADGDFAPYFTRRQIEAGALRGRGLELVYLEDPIDTYFMHVQGCGAVLIPGGGLVRLTFDGKNGHPYTSIGKILIARGALNLEEATLDGIVAFLRAHPNDALDLLVENESYIFFKMLPPGAEGPQGSAGAFLTAGRSLAADVRLYPFGSPVWVSAPELVFEGRPLARLMVVQDTGSAITGPGRGDIFAGSGEEAGRVAGTVRHACKFIALKPKTSP